jgi:geranylgeranyl pyrophosphate synthase
MSRLDTFFADVTETIDATLAALIPTELIHPRNLHAAMRWSVFAGGKRFRPALCLAVGECSAHSAERIENGGSNRDDSYVFADSRRFAGDGRRRFAARTRDLSRQIRRSDGDFGGRHLQTLAFQTIAEMKIYR